MTTVNQEKPIKKGLNVEVISDHSDYSIFTSITIRFVVPSIETPIDKDAMTLIDQLFKKYIHIVGYDKSIFHYEILSSTGIRFNMWESLDKDTALQFVVEMCQYVCGITIPEEKSSDFKQEDITCLENTQRFIAQFLIDITENGMYEYEEVNY